MLPVPYAAKDQRRFPNYFFFKCNKTMPFWLSLNEVLECHPNRGIRILHRNVILGAQHISLDFGLLLFKAFVWRQRRSAGSLTLQLLKTYVKTTAQVQLYVRLEIGNQSVSKNVWRPLCDALNIENSF